VDLHLAARIGFGVMTPMLIVGAVFAPRVHVRQPLCLAGPLVISTSLPDVSSHGVRAEGEPLAVSTGPTDGPGGTNRAGQPDEKHDGSAIDLYGNDVSDAVAKYKLDATGSLYELHSPQTELPRLGSPKS
jgi:hypothetical protein